MYIHKYYNYKVGRGGSEGISATFFFFPFLIFNVDQLQGKRTYIDFFL